MKPEAEMSQLFSEILRLLGLVNQKIIAGDLSDEAKQQLHLVYDMLQEIDNRPTSTENKKRGRKKDTTPYRLKITEERKTETVQLLWAMQKIGVVSRIYDDGRVKVANVDEAVQYFMNVLFDEDLENPRQYVDAAFNRDKPTKPFEKMLTAAEERVRKKKGKG